MDEEIKDTLVQHHVAGLPRYQQELVRDLAYHHVDVPVTWLAPGDVAILTLDPEARLSRGQAIRCAALLVEFVHLVEVIAALTGTALAARKAAGTLPARAEVESLRRGRGPNRIRDLLFEQLPGWPSGVPGHLRDEVDQVLDRCLQDRLGRQGAEHREPQRLQQVVVPLLPAVRDLVLDYARRVGARPPDASALVSEVVDQLIRTVAQQNRPPDNLTAWTRTTARWKWRALRPGWAAAVPAADSDPQDLRDVAEEAAQRLDLRQRLKAIAARLRADALRLEQQPPPRPGAGRARQVAADLVETCDVELITGIVRGTPEGVAAVRRALEADEQQVSLQRQDAIVELIKITLRRELENEA